MESALEVVFSSAVLLIMVMDPLGNIPPMLAILKGTPEARRRPIIARELVVAFGVLLVFLFLGQRLLDLLSLQQESVTISGGIILLIIGLRMIFPQAGGVMGESPGGEPFIVPIAIPMIAGPSALATLILMVRRDPTQMVHWFFALLVAWLVVAALMLSAPLLFRIFRERGLAALERLMGMLLVMMAVQMFIDGIKGFM